jgi:anti-sigma regulatory factor (Ser/Thr protein kinase)
MSPVREVARFDPEFASVGDARRFVRDVLARWSLGERERDASVLVTELCSNSVLHGRGAYSVTISCTENVLRIAVRDPSRRLPAPKPHSRAAMTGRGLTLVGAYADEWGVERHKDGKTVWATLSLRSSSPTRRPPEAATARPPDTPESGPSTRRGRNGRASAQARALPPDGRTRRRLAA